MESNMTPVKMIVSTLALAACVAAAPASAKPISVLGTWTIVSSTPAPWVKPGEPPLPSDEKELIGHQIVFSKNAVTAPSPPLNARCRKPNYEYRNYDFGWLFEGNLPEPQDKAAAALASRRNSHRASRPAARVSATSAFSTMTPRSSASTTASIASSGKSADGRPPFLLTRKQS
jgi:hypothetical protein